MAAETRAPSVPSVPSDTTSLLQEKLVAISRAVRDAIVMIDNDGGVAHWNEAAETIFGYSKQEALGKNLHQLLAPQRYHAAHRTAFESFRLGGEGDAIGKTLELVGRRKSGQEFPLELSLAPMQFEGKWCAVGLVRDITERKRIEERLQRSEARYRETFEGASVGQAIVGLDGRFQEVNATFARLLGYGKTELFGRSFQDVTYPDDRTASLNDAIEATLIIAHNEYRYVADIETHFEELPLVSCHVGDLNQVFLNLLVNASTTFTIRLPIDGTSAPARAT